MVKHVNITRISKNKSVQKDVDIVAAEIKVRIMNGEEAVYETTASPSDIDMLERGYLYCKSGAHKSYKTFCFEDYANAGSILEKMLADIPWHRETANIHSAGLITPDRTVYVAEDIGRHNAIYKVIGKCIAADDSPSDYLLTVSSRGSLLIMEIAYAAGIGGVVVKGAPTDAAVDFSVSHNMLLW